MRLLLFTVLLATTSCSPKYTEEQCYRFFSRSDTIRYTVRKDTTIYIKGATVRDTITIDHLVTLTERDTITQYDPKTGMELQIWKDRYGQILAKCSRKDTVVVIPETKEITNVSREPNNIKPEDNTTRDWLLGGIGLVSMLTLLAMVYMALKLKT